MTGHAVAPNRAGMIEDLFTLPTARRRGVITGVIAALVDRLRAANYDPVFLGAFANDRPKHLYARLGFRSVTLARTWVHNRRPQPPPSWYLWSWRGLHSSAPTPESLGLRNPETTPTQFQPPPRRDLLDRKVTIKDGLGARPVTAEEAFLLYLRKKALDGNEVAQERLEEIQAFRRKHDPDVDPRDDLTIVRSIVSPDNPNHALRLLKMAEKLYPFQPHAQIKLEPWLVQRALDRLGDRRLNAKQQATVVAATRTPGKVQATVVAATRTPGKVRWIILTPFMSKKLDSRIFCRPDGGHYHIITSPSFLCAHYLTG